VIFTFQSTAHIGLLKGTPNAVKSVWEPKEGGKVNSYRNCPGQAQNLEKAKIIIGHFVENDPDNSGFWCVAKT
jgi:hypothetical protein